MVAQPQPPLAGNAAISVQTTIPPAADGTPVPGKAQDASLRYVGRVKDALVVSLLSLTPRNHGARGMGWFARSPLSRWMTGLFVRMYGVNLAEAEGTLADYPTLEALFTRGLKPGARPIDPGADALVSPVDGRCAFVGPMVDGRIQVAPGKFLDVGRLVGRACEPSDVAVLYLSPKDYHRIHCPREGVVRRWSYIPGTLWPVFPAAVRRVDDLFAKNERAVVCLETSEGPVDVVLVGAFGVGRITLEVCDLVTNTGGQARSGDIDAALGRGDQLGVFHLGSTVILVAPAGRWRWSVAVGDVVRLGRTIATVAR